MTPMGIASPLNLFDGGSQLQDKHLLNMIEAWESAVTSSIMKKPKIELIFIRWFYIPGTMCGLGIH